MIYYLALSLALVYYYYYCYYYYYYFGKLCLYSAGWVLTHNLLHSASKSEITEPNVKLHQHSEFIILGFSELHGSLS